MEPNKIQKSRINTERLSYAAIMFWGSEFNFIKASGKPANDSRFYRILKGQSRTLDIPLWFDMGLSVSWILMKNPPEIDWQKGIRHREMPFALTSEGDMLKEAFFALDDIDFYLRLQKYEKKVEQQRIERIELLGATDEPLVDEYDRLVLEYQALSIEEKRQKILNYYKDGKFARSIQKVIQEK